MKYHNNLMKSPQDIERTSSGLPTYRQVQSNMPSSSKGGIKIYYIIHVINLSTEICKSPGTRNLRLGVLRDFFSGELRFRSNTLANSVCNSPI
jgi:hypothetical protein